MKQIELTQGQIALVDDADFEELSKYKWQANYFKHTNSFYATRHTPAIKGKHYVIYMHRQILGLERGDSRQADHINHITLDNRQSNLRICTRQQNEMNRKPNRNTTSQYKGVCWDKARRKWRALIYLNGVSKHLGFFQDEEAAARAYNEAAKKYFREFAFLNKIP